MMKAALNAGRIIRGVQVCQRVSAPRVRGRFFPNASMNSARPLPYFATRCIHVSSGKDGNDLPTQGDLPAFADVPGVQTTGEKMIIMFTCTVCDTRSARKISKQAYAEGVVMVRCDCCKNRYLIADRMGVFEDSIEGNSGWDIQKYMAEQGENVRSITDENVYELTVEDIVGAKKAAALQDVLDKKKD